MIELTGNTLTLEKLKDILYRGKRAKIANDSLEKVRASRRAVERIVKGKESIYGINTGFGKFSNVKIAEENVAQLQLNLIRSHACGVGEPFSKEIAKAMIVLRLNALLKGYSGVRVEVVQLLEQLINKNIIPVIPRQGSLGASGDLVPLAHLALIPGKIVPTKMVLEKYGIKPITLQAKEGLALINGTQTMTAIGAVNYLEAEKLAFDSEWIASMSFEALEGIIDAFFPETHKVRGFIQQTKVAERMLDWLKGSKLTTRQGEKRVQDAYSLRCIPQVHGAVWQVLDYVKEKLEIEMNAATDKPLIFDEGKTVISGGNFHGQPIAFAMDFLKVALAELANISERRIERLVNAQLNESLPPFLSPEPGLQSGVMILQYVAASLVSENKTLAHPASVDSIPSSANQEDHVSMGTIAASHAREIIQKSRRVLTIEAICAMQALSYKGIENASPKIQEKWKLIHKIVPTIQEDRVFQHDIDRLNDYLKELK